MADMITVREYKDATALLVAAAVADLDTVWQSLDLSDIVATRTALEVVLPEITTAYGGAVATLAADRFEAFRADAGVPGDFHARPAETADPERVNASMRAALSPLLGAEPDVDAALDEVHGVTQRMVQRPGRDTLAVNAERDPAAIGYRRRLTGNDNCGFCVMLAAQPTLYGSREQSIFTSSGNRYHNGCDCQPDPVYDRDVHRYDPERIRMEERYSEAQEVLGNTSNLDDIAYAIRALGEGRTPEHIRAYVANPKPRNPRVRR